jgi:hypothetical protein
MKADVERSIHHQHRAAISHKVVEWRATADEDGHYCFAVAL